jgi:hypothetical protein
VLLRAKFLAAGQTLNDLAGRVVISGKPLESFEALIAAVDGAGQREGKRLPIVIDGLNESEDPRDWKDLLGPLAIVMREYSNVQVICTVRTAFVSECIPDDTEVLEIPGFVETDLIEAIRRYFAHYKIDARDAELPWELLSHPLTLRIFCEVANPDRKQTVGAGSIPSSLSTLFERYLELIATQIAEAASPACRYFVSDIRQALSTIGLALWKGCCRDLEIIDLRHQLGDHGRSWDKSIVNALEQEGVLFRERGRQGSSGRMSVIYDALAGHIVADALLAERSGREFSNWVQRSDTMAVLSTRRFPAHNFHDSVSRFLAARLPQEWQTSWQNLRDRFFGTSRRSRHPLASDIFRALVWLTPYRQNRRQLWPLLEGQLRSDALVESAYMDGRLLDKATVAQLTNLVRRSTPGRRDLINRLFATRAALAHPQNAEFLDDVLRSMRLPDRDLRWSEWIRREAGVPDDLHQLQSRWKGGNFKDKEDYLRAKWVMWIMTSTVRRRRDEATYALYWYGCHDPNGLFDLTLGSLDINDPYVPERMLAASYGVAMGFWADPGDTKVRSALPGFAAKLVDQMFVPQAPRATCHALTLGYALGLIALAMRVDSNAIPPNKNQYVSAPLDHLPSPFPNATAITDAQVAGADEAMHMDFENYTLGHLVRDRHNYDFENATYKEVRRQIEYRIVSLGYSPQQFSEIDRMIATDGWRAESQGKAKIDRYGKKYSWIAYFEMYGIRSLRRQISEHNSDSRPSEADIDPSFPEAPRVFNPTLPELFSGAPSDLRGWINDGPIPDYMPLLQAGEIDGQKGPWVLVQRFIEQGAPSDSRRIFTFLRGVIAAREHVAPIIETFGTMEYPGNHAIPEPSEDYYVYFGEIPWSSNFAAGLRDFEGKPYRDKRSAFDHHDGTKWIEGIPVEVPVCEYRWESYHSDLNKVSGVTVPPPALAERLGLSGRRGELDFYDPTGRLATLYRVFKGGQDSFESHLFWVRADLMAEYLARDDELIWLVWGERGLQYKDTKGLETIRQFLAGHRHIHRFSSVWRR